MRLPFESGDEKVDAQFTNGVLTVRIGARRPWVHLQLGLSAHDRSNVRRILLAHAAECTGVAVLSQRLPVRHEPCSGL